MLGFIKKHKILTIILGVFLLIFLVLVIIRVVRKSNGSFKEQRDVSSIELSADGSLSRDYTGDVIEEQESKYRREDEEMGDSSSEQSSTPSNTDTTGTTQEATQKPDDDNGTKYNSNLSINAQQERKRKQEEEARRLKLEEERRRREEDKRIKEAIKNRKPTYGSEVLCWGTDGVPETMVDGSSLKEFYKRTDITDFSGNWGSKLSDKDKITKKLHLVGVNQNPNDKKAGYSCESFGWLIDNIDKLDRNACIKFTDLNTVGSLAKDHVALLCNYDWYSAFGMTDTMAYFEDMSGTLNKSNFQPGTIFSAYTHVHNIKIKKVNGFNVVCIRYYTF